MHRFLARELVFVIIYIAKRLLSSGNSFRRAHQLPSDGDQEFRDAGRPDLSYEDLCRLAMSGGRS